MTATRPHLRSPATMRAIVQTGYGSPDALELQDVPRPVVTDDTVRVRIRAASINAFDWGFVRMRAVHVIAGLVGARPSRIRGADLAGVVEACGAGVRRYKPGDEVFGAARGTLAEYATTTEARLAIKPPALTFEQAAALPVAGCTAIQAVRDHARVQAGQRILVYGAGGGTGTYLVQLAKAAGAHVTAVTRTGSLELLRSIGADRVIDYTREDFTRDAERYDALFDVGANRSLADCARAVTPRGKLVLVGAPKQVGSLVARLLGTLVPQAGHRPILFTGRIRREDMDELARLVETGRLSPAIDRTYLLSETRAAFRAFAAGGVKGKIVITIP